MMNNRAVLRSMKAFSFILCLVLTSSSAFAAMKDEDFVNLCFKGSAEKIEEALEQGAFIEAHMGGHNQWSPILAAAYENPDPRVIELLAEFGANVNVWASDYLSVSNYFEDGDHETVRMYNCMPTPLMVAAYCNPNPEVVRALIEAGAKVNVMTGYNGRNKITPLGWALRRPPMKSQEETEATKSTQSNGKGLLLSASNNQTEVLADSDPRTAIVKILVEAGADINKIDDGTNCALMAAWTFPVVKVLLEAGADVKAVNSYGSTTLHLAATASTVDIIDIIVALLDAGADINARNKNDQTPLHYASQASNPEVITLLVDRGANVNMQDSKGNTPLINAVRGENAKPEVVSFLLDKGADVNIKDESGKRAVDYARTNRKLAGPVLRRLVKESHQ